MSHSPSYANLPKDLQQQIYNFLSADDFQSAKEIYDQWFNANPSAAA